MATPVILIVQAKIRLGGEFKELRYEVAEAKVFLHWQKKFVSS